MFAVRHEADKVILAVPRGNVVFLTMSTAESVYHTLTETAALAIPYPPVRDGRPWQVGVSVPGNAVCLTFTPPEDAKPGIVPMLPAGAIRLAEAIKAAVTHLRGREAPNKQETP